MQVKKLSLNEFLEEKKKYFTTSGNENIVVKCISTSGYQFWTKHKTLEDIAKIYWKHEPLVKRSFNNVDEVFEQLKKSNPDGIVGCAFRWLPGNFVMCDEVCLQPYIYRNNTTIKEIEEGFKASLNDRMFCMLMDPYTYIGNFDGYKNDEDIDSNDENDEFINKEEMMDINNYCVFVTEISSDEYDKQEQNYINSIESTIFDDGFIKINRKNIEISEKFEILLKEHAKWFK